MIRIWLWEVPLPPQLQFLANPLGSAAATLAFWLLLALLLQLLVLRCSRPSLGGRTAKSKT